MKARFFFLSWLLCSFGVVSPSFMSAQPAPAQSVASLSKIRSPESLGDPAFFAGNDSGFVLVDYSTMGIYRANPNGEWTHSRTSRGSGPGEYRDISGAAIDERGVLWITDAGNARLSRLSSELEVLSEVTTEQPLRSAAPGTGTELVALPVTVQHFAVRVDQNGAVRDRVPWTSLLSSVNPILRERYVLRTSDSITTVQFRWLDRRIGIGNDGRIRYDVGNANVQPKVLAISLDRSGSTAYRVDPESEEFALSVAAQRGTLYVLRGSDNERSHGTEIVTYNAETGLRIGAIKLPRPCVKIAASGGLLLAIAETEDGYDIFRVIY